MGRPGFVRIGAVGFTVGLLGLSLTSCVYAIHRPDEPVVVTGAQLTSLLGKAPQRIVGFAHLPLPGAPDWVQVPVQIDERDLVPYGTPTGLTAGNSAHGSVYGQANPQPLGTMQYTEPQNAHAALPAIADTDAQTWLGPDHDLTFDADDELVVMAADAGDPFEGEPAHVVAGSGVRLRLDDPLEATRHGYVYLFESDGSLDPGAGRDYVNYDFSLDSGPYETTYKNLWGPNPEHSSVITDAYEIRFHDRWVADDWFIRAAGSSGADVLDAEQSQVFIGTLSCFRHNGSFREQEGAFVANIDGPVRAIRSFVGANSGPYTQRTYRMYRDRVDTTTDLRVHEIPNVTDYVDFNTTATGMTYSSSSDPEGVPIDGVPDPSVGDSVNTWELVTGPHGSMTMADSVQTNIDPAARAITGFYRDQLNDPVDPRDCWSDRHHIGATGSRMDGVGAWLPNTDPSTGPAAKDLRFTRIVRYSAPGVTAAQAADWQAKVAAPITVTAAPLGR